MALADALVQNAVRRCVLENKKVRFCTGANEP